MADNVNGVVVPGIKRLVQISTMDDFAPRTRTGGGGRTSEFMDGLRALAPNQLHIESYPEMTSEEFKKRANSVQASINGKLPYRPALRTIAATRTIQIGRPIGSDWAKDENGNFITMRGTRLKNGEAVAYEHKLTVAEVEEQRANAERAAAAASNVETPASV